MKTYSGRFIITLMLLAVFCTGVLAQEEADSEAINKLLTDGEISVSVNQLLLSANFDDDGEWATASSKGYEAVIKDGVYLMNLKSATELQTINFDTETDTVIQVKTQQVSESTENAYGVMCRASTRNNGDGYYFQISGDGFYSITKVDGEPTVLVNWERSKAINPGTDENELLVVCAGDYLALYVNEVLVAETHDDTFSKGNTGFAITAFGGKTPVEIEFDDVRVWATNTDNGGTTLVKPTGTSTTETKPAEATDSLTSYDEDAKDAIRELEQLGMIPSGSSLIFTEDYAYFTGQGSWFTPLANRAPHQNIVMAGELTFTVGNTSEFESCTMTSRIKQDDRGTAVTYIDVGIGNDNFAYILDQYSETQDARYEIGTTELDLSVPHHILFMLIDDVATVYVDGELEITDFTVNERSGSYGIGLIGAGPNARCDGRNIWAYSVPNVQAGECAVQSTSNANKRTGPGTNFDIAGQLVAGDDTLVIGQGKDADGKLWWQLEDESWVREDLVTAVGDCANIPIAEAP